MIECSFENCHNAASETWGYVGCDECFSKIVKKHKEIYCR